MNLLRRAIILINQVTDQYDRKLACPINNLLCELESMHLVHATVVSVVAEERDSIHGRNLQITEQLATHVFFLVSNAHLLIFLALHLFVGIVYECLPIEHLHKKSSVATCSFLVHFEVIPANQRL